MKIQHVPSLCGQFYKWKWIVTLKKMSRGQRGGDFILQRVFLRGLCPPMAPWLFFRGLYPPFGNYLVGSKLLKSTFWTEFCMGSLSRHYPLSRPIPAGHIPPWFFFFWGGEGLYTLPLPPYTTDPMLIIYPLNLERNMIGSIVFQQFVVWVVSRLAGDRPMSPKF